MKSDDASGVDENLVRDLYLFFELVCQRCDTTWAPANPSEGLSTVPELWAEQFSEKFGAIAQGLGWGSLQGNVVCPSCLALASATRES
jgi:hypothetical protein